MIERCGFCLHYKQSQGLFGDCTAGMREGFDGTTFSTNAACPAFIHKEKGKGNVKPLGNAPEQSPFTQFMAGPGAVAVVFSNAMLRQNKQQDHDECSKEDKIPWQNPIVKRKTPKRVVVDFEEARKSVLKRRKLNSNL